MTNNIKIFIYLMITTLLTVTSNGCSEEDVIESTIIDETLYLEFLEAIPSEGGSREMKFNASSDWNISINDTRTSSWLSVTPSSGGAGSRKATITAIENDNPDDRQSKITISAGSINQYINVIQKRKDALTVTSSRFEVAKDGGNIAVEVKPNIDFDVYYSESWISQVQSETLTANKLTFEISPNEEAETRIGRIMISGEDFAEEIKVFQVGKEVLILSRKEYDLSGFEVNIAVELSLNFDFEIVMPDIDWIKESTTRAISSHTRHFDILKNEIYDARSAEIIFKSKDGTTSETIIINQAQKDTVIIDEALDIEFLKAIPSKGGSRELNFNASSPWTIGISDTRTSSWLNITPLAGLNGDSKITITAAENTTHDDRFSKITIYSGNLAQDISIIQKQKDALTTTSSRFDIAKEGDNIVVELKSNTDFEVTIAENCKNWISRVQTKALTTHELTFKISPSEELETRSGVITISGGGFSEEITVFQAGKEVLVLSEKEYNLSSEGDDIAIELSLNFDFDIVMPDVDWIKESTIRAVSSHTRYFSILPNTTYDARSAEIIFNSKNGTASETITVNQAQKGAIIVSTKQFKLGTNGGDIDVNLESSVEFELSIDCDWIAQLSTRALETHNLRFKVEPYDGETRIAKIKVKDKNSSLFDEITITQIGTKQERQALIAFYKATAGDNWINNTNWCSDKPIGEWYGLRDNGNGVFAIDLQSNQLTGSIPTEIGDLPELRTLLLSNNRITGDLDVSSNTKLYHLHCTDNKIRSVDISLNKSLTSFTCTNNQNLSFIWVWENFNETTYENFYKPEATKYLIKNRDHFSLDKEEYTASSAGEVMTIKTLTNLGYSISLSGIDWIEEITSKSLTQNTHQFRISENHNATERNGNILFRTDAGVEYSVKVTQVSRTSVYQLPVIFHVLYNDKSDYKQYIDEGYLESLLNRATKLTNARNDLKIMYILAENDKDGNPLKEKGVNRVHVSQLGAKYDRHLIRSRSDMRDIQYDVNKYINIYIYTMIDESVAGDANYPYVRSTNPLDGIYSGNHYLNTKPSYLHSIGLNASYIYSDGSTNTLTHELGHYLGLRHVFYEKNDSDQKQNDYCDDTYTYDRDWYEDEYIQSVNGDEQLKRYDRFKNHWFVADNIMDYWHIDTENETFTNDQKRRMHHIIKYGICVPNIYQSKTRSSFSTESIPVARIAD